MGETERRDPYTVLGVGLHASQDELRAAYRRKAFELHPDRSGGGDPSEWPGGRMAELNAAWQSIGDPERRRDVDRARADASAAHAATQRGAATPGPRAPAVSDAPLRHGSPPSLMAAMAGIVPWGALVLLLGAILVFTAYAGGPSDEGPAESGGTIVVRDVRGSCIRQADGFTLVVNCGSSPHEGRIVAQGSIGAECPTGTRAFVVPQEDIVACADPDTAAP
ncbi:MAG: J domain-containing protein [Acidimicrobiia bacterium]|nr:J domain-containing protein [Acidimicrobiia bacterium]